MVKKFFKKKQEEIDDYEEYADEKEFISDNEEIEAIMREELRLEPDEHETEDGFRLSQEDRRLLKKSMKGKEVDLDVNAKRQLVEQIQLEALEKELSQGDVKPTMAERLDRLFKLIPLPELVIYYFVFLLANIVYLFILSDNIIISIAASAIASFMLVNSFILKTRKATRERNNLYQIGQYATTLVHHLKNGASMQRAYAETALSITGDVRYNVIHTLRHLERTAELNTDSFYKFEMKELDVYHSILDMYYRQGARDVGKMFESNLKDILVLIEMKNTMTEMKKTRASILYFMAGLATGIPIFVATSMGTNYELVLTNPIAPMLIGVYHIINVWNISKINKMVSDLTLK